MHRRRDGRRGPPRGRALNATIAPTIGAEDTSLGGELRTLVRLSIPIAIAQLGLMSMSLVDTAVLGRVSVDDLAGAGMGRSIGFTAAIVGMGVTAALEPMAAQAIGAGEHGHAWRALVANVKAALLLLAPCILAAFAVTYTLVPAGVDPAVVSRIRLYLVGQTPGFAAMLVFFSTKTFLQAHGKTRPALLGSLAANVVNFVVSNLLVRGDGALRAVGLPAVGLPGWGALGAGIAFSISCLVLLSFTGVAALAYRAKDSGPAIPLRGVYRLGLPVGLQMLAEMGIFSLVAVLAGVLGPEVASAHQVAIGMAAFTFMGALGVSGATAVRVGHAVGAGRSARPAGILGISLGAAVMMVGVVSFLTVPELLVSAFTTDPRVTAIGVRLVRIAAIFQLFDGVQCVAAGALRGAGDVRFPFVANVVAHWLVGFPIAMTLGFALHLGAPGMWWGLTAGLVAISTALALRFAHVSRRIVKRV